MVAKFSKFLYAYIYIYIYIIYIYICMYVCGGEVACVYKALGSIQHPGSGEICHFISLIVDENMFVS